MTPNLNSNPLAALTNGAASTTIGTGVSADSPAEQPGNTAINDKSESRFLDVLQVYSVTSSMETANVSGPGLADRVLIPELEAPDTVLGGLPESGQEFMPVALPVTVPNAGLVSAGTTTGSRQPQGGNPLPPFDVASQPGVPESDDAEGADAHLTKSAHMQATISQAGSGLAAPRDLTMPPAMAESTLVAKQMQRPLPTGIPDAVLPASNLAPSAVPVATPLTQETPLPQPLLPLPQWSNQPSIPINSGNAATITQALADVAALTAEVDETNPESMRINTVAPAAERSSAQSVVPALPLARVAGSPGWDQGLGQRILWMVDNGLNQAELRLDPPHLGSVNIRIMMQDDQAQLMFQAAHPAAREALELALPKLREMFNQQGLELGDADVSDHNDPSTNDDGQQGEPLIYPAPSMQAGDHEESEVGNTTTSIMADRISDYAYVDEFV